MLDNRIQYICDEICGQEQRLNLNIVIVLISSLYNWYRTGRYYIIIVYMTTKEYKHNNVKSRNTLNIVLDRQLLKYTTAFLVLDVVLK